jgi:transposase
MSKFRLIDRDTGFLLPPSVDEWLPERHLARFVVEVIEGLDLRAMIGRYRGCGEAAYHPRLLLGILVYGYATGVFSSRKLERATYDSVAFRFIAANQHPDHDTIAAFRRRFLPHIEALFVQVLLLAREIGVLQLGTVALDGTKIHANASRHSALSYEHASQIEAQLRAEVADLLAKAEAADQVPLPDGLSVPEELARREGRLAEIARARAIIEARAKERHAREQAEYEAKMTARAVKAAATGRNPRGRPPMPPIEQPGPTDQVNLTDEESRIMPVPGGGFEQCYNAQACVVAGSLLVVANHVVQAANDKQQIEPMLGKLATLPAALGQVETLLADTGYFSEANVQACVTAGIDPLIAMGRQPHHPPLAARFAPDPPPPEQATPLAAMAHRLQTQQGKTLYALRKHTPEPVFGIIKAALGFRQFLLRGLNKVRGEWNLVTMAYNLKRLFVLAGATSSEHGRPDPRRPAQARPQNAHRSAEPIRALG